jgi:hypothetical protein
MRRDVAAVVAALAAVVGLSVVPVLVQGQGAQPKPRTPEIETSSRKAPPFRPEALNWKPTVTPWGDPDLQGEWMGSSPTPLQRPREGEHVLTDPVELARRFDEDSAAAAREGTGIGTYQAAWREYGREISYHPAFKGRTGWIVDPPDGRLPPLTPEAQKRVDERRARGRQPSATGRTNDRTSEPPPPAGPEDRSAEERCIGYHIAIEGNVSQWYRIVQTPGWVAINQYRMHDMRLVPLDNRPHKPQDVREWMGDSRGHWEGRTLVVETTNFNGKNSHQGSDANLRLVERFTRIDEDTIKYEYTVEDPTVWTRPWSVSVPLARDTDGFFEYACHEANYAMVGMLSGAREQERKAANPR